jgi:hypothetical protein
MRQDTPKAEIRDSKSEARKKSEIRNPRGNRVGVSCSAPFSPARYKRIGPSGFGLLSDFATSVFGFRAALLLALAFCPTSLWACAACTGLSDSSLAVGMNWGILTLLGVVLTVLSGVLVFFVHVIRKEETASNDATPKNPPGA